MAAPEFVPRPPTEKVRRYASPDHIPDNWMADRPAELDGRQPEGGGLGFQGPDQGFALRLAEHLRPKVVTQPGESVDDALRGCVGIGLRRASLFGRAPMIHDLTLALTAWGFLDPSPPAELVARRGTLFAGVANTHHHYAELLALVDRMPEETLRLSHTAVQQAYPARWRELLGE
jgi:hypothetical protein